MSNPYPSRRELRLQREREARAKLRDTEAQRWTEEVEQRQPQSDEKVDPILHAPDEDNALDQADSAPEDLLGPGRRASARPVDRPADTEAIAAEDSASSRRQRRADSEVTSTGMLPIISKPRDEQKVKPASRREARQLESHQAAQRRAEIERLQRQQGGVEEPKNQRRATAPQTTPPPVSVAIEPTTGPKPPKQVAPASQEPAIEDLFDVEITATHPISATEITDLSGLDTIDIRRAELRAETERLTREIITLGESNPNVIDPQLLRRQKELAEKSHELQGLETAAIEIVEAEKQDKLVGAPDSDPESEPATSDTVDSTSQLSTVSDEDTAAVTKQTRHTGRASGRLRRRTTDGPFVTGPFEVNDEDDSTSEPSKRAKSGKPPLAEFIRAPLAPEPEREPRQPVDASSAHGLDTLDAKDVEAPERRLIISAAIMFAIGVIALIVAIILFNR